MQTSQISSSHPSRGEENESACKPDSVRAVSTPGDHPSGITVTGDLLRLTRDDSTGHRRPCLALLRVGFTEPPRSPEALVVSYTTVSPLPVPSDQEGHRRSVLCGTFRRVTPPGRYPAPCPVESGLSSGTSRSSGARGHPANSL